MAAAVVLLLCGAVFADAFSRTVQFCHRQEYFSNLLSLPTVHQFSTGLTAAKQLCSSSRPFVAHRSMNEVHLSHACHVELR